MLRIPVNINGVSISAVVDTASEITILSETVYDSMSPHPRVLSHVDANLAGGGATMSVGSLGPVQLGISGLSRTLPVCRPITRSMLLGIDCIQNYLVKIDWGLGNFSKAIVYQSS